MSTFSPRSVDPNSIWRWLREALALTRRQWVLLVLLDSGWIVAHNYLRSLPAHSADTIGTVLGLALALLLLSLFMIVAQAADRSTNALMFITTRLLACSVRVMSYFLVTLSIAIIFGVALLAGFEWLDTGQPLPPPQDAGGGAGIQDGFGPNLALLFFMIHIAVGYWFVFPLLTLVDLPFLTSLRLALDAFYRNSFVWKAGVVLCLLTAFAPPLLVAAIGPVLGAVLYVSYRHVFEGQADNSPRVVRSSAVQPPVAAGS